ncbi:MAG: hypothetical protein JWM95_730 [Gemmatimonadetes bacterium]|nr:hypothetical protein [Gemmatimonadota bacterium]
MLSLSHQLLIAKARALVGTGLVAEIALDETSSDGDASVGFLHVRARPSWDLAFVQHCGYWSHRDPSTGRSSWPIPRNITRSELAQFGTARRILHERPSTGDIFLQYGPSRKAFVHVGIVMAVLDEGAYELEAPYFDLYTVEGDTGVHGQLRGGKTLRVRRRLCPGRGDRFLSWMELDPHVQQLARSLSLPAASIIRCA